MSDTKHRLGEEQQLVYRIDCDKCSTIDGPPLELILQKESAKPILLILFGTQIHPSKKPVIKDQRRNKGQGYILQDQRKPPPILASTHPNKPNHLTSSTLPYLSLNCDPYQQQSMHHQQYPTDLSPGSSPFGQFSYDLSYNNQTMAWDQQQYHNPSFGDGYRPYPFYQPSPLCNNQPYTLSNDNMMICNGMGSIKRTSASSFYRHFDRMMSMQQNNNIPYASRSLYNQQFTPTMQSNPAHQTSTGTVPPPPPAFRMMNGPRSTKSALFGPLSGYTVV